MLHRHRGRVGGSLRCVFISETPPTLQSPDSSASTSATISWREGLSFRKRKKKKKSSNAERKNVSQVPRIECNPAGLFLQDQFSSSVTSRSLAVTTRIIKKQQQQQQNTPALSCQTAATLRHSGCNPVISHRRVFERKCSRQIPVFQSDKKREGDSFSGAKRPLI